jgi:hypothetical protein
VFGRVGPKSAYRWRTCASTFCSKAAPNLRFEGRPRNPCITAWSPSLAIRDSSRRTCRSHRCNRAAPSTWFRCPCFTSCKTRMQSRSR